MNRRKFLNRLSLAGAGAFALNGIPMQVMSNTKPLQRLASLSTNDRVLIILQLHGGNDGINTLIPVSDYDLYYFRRPNLAIPSRNSNRRFIPLDATLPLADQIGLHPDMLGVKQLYDQGKVRIVQGVSYENNNGSHFRGQDILLMGGGSDDYLGSGWIGRFLENNYVPLTYPADFPNAEMLDPLALEFGNDISLAFHQSNNIPTSISINNPNQFFDLVTELEGFEDVEGTDPRGIPPQAINDSPYGKELNWILDLEQKSEDYAERLKQVYDIGNAIQSNAIYPELYPFSAPSGISRNRLAGQFQIIAKLLSGGCQTKVFLVKIGGFDTHASQVTNYDTTMGVHAALLYHISATMKAFQDDLRARGIEDRVLTMTTSEFGRRIFSNGSYGTDHGTGAPMMLFGSRVNPGVLGTVPNLNRDNVEQQYDYRQVYSTILKDWFQVDATLVDGGNPSESIIRGDYPDRGVTLPLINNNTITSIDRFVDDRFKLYPCYPNPAKDKTVIKFYINSPAEVTLELVDSYGKVVEKILDHEPKTIGEHQVTVSTAHLKAGMYLYRINAGLLKKTRKLMVVN